MKANSAARRQNQSESRSPVVDFTKSPDFAFRQRGEGRIIGLRTNRYSWWTHWRELADYELPRRYKWLITPNQQSRGSPINQHILDSTGTLALRNLAAGLMSGTDPTRPWFRLKIGNLDSTQTSPVSLWLSECERILQLIFHESNFYNAIAVLYFDLVVFGTGVMLIYEDFENVIHCYNPCLGEYYLDNDGTLRPVVFAREFTYTVSQVVDEFGYNNCSPSVQRLYDQEDGASLARELIVAHIIEPNTGPNYYGIPKHFKFRELYWEWGGSGGLQGGVNSQRGVLRKRGYHDNPAIAVRWDLVSNDAYGRSPGMDMLPDVKQLQHETRRKAQGIDKQVNPPMVADIQMKNQPASLIPGGVTYVAGFSQTKSGFAPAYQVMPDIKGMMEDIKEIQQRVKDTAYNNLFQTISQYETRSNVTAAEIDARRAESMIMLGPALGRIYNEGLKQVIDRTFSIAARAMILPPAPREIAGQNIEIQFMSILAQAQAAAAVGNIERLFQVLGSLEGIAPEAIDNVDVDYGLEKISSLLNNDPKLIRAPAQLQQIRQMRQQQQQAAAQAQQAEQLSKGAKTLSETNIGGDRSALQAMLGAA